MPRLIAIGGALGALPRSVRPGLLLGQGELPSRGAGALRGPGDRVRVRVRTGAGARDRPLPGNRAGAPALCVR